MVAHLVRLKLLLLRNGLRRSGWQVAGLVVGGLYAFGVLVGALAGIVALAVQGDLEARRIAVGLAGALLVVAWWLVPLVTAGVDATVDPARFVTFPIPHRQLVAGLGVGGLVGIPGVTTALVTVAAAAVWWRSPAALVAALVCVPLVLALCVAGSRVTTTALAPLLGRRRVRELLAALAVLPLLAIGPLMSTLGSAGVTYEGVARAAGILGWTPPGAVWLVPALVEQGDWLGALARLAVAAASCAALVAAWSSLLRRALVTPAHDETRVRARGLAWFGRLPGTPLGAVAARSLTYWFRDPRYAQAIAIVPLLPVFFWFADRDGAAVLWATPIVAFTTAWSIAGDVALDSTAFALHQASPLRGWVDRAGRALAAGSLALAVLLAVVVVAAAVTGRTDLVPAVLGLSGAVLLVALGVASVTSALVVYPVARPGDNPFAVRQGATAASFATQLGGWLAVGVLVVPVLVLAVLAARAGGGPLGWATLVAGFVVGAGALVVGVVVGGNLLERRGPELLARMRSFT